MNDEKLTRIVEAVTKQLTENKAEEKPGSQTDCNG